MNALELANKWRNTKAVDFSDFEKMADEMASELEKSHSIIAKYQKSYEEKEVRFLYLMKDNDDLKIKNDLLDAKHYVLLSAIHLCVTSFLSEDKDRLELAIKKANEILIKYGE